MINNVYSRTCVYIYRYILTSPELLLLRSGGLDKLLGYTSPLITEVCLADLAR